MATFFKNLFGGSAPKPTLSANQGLEQLEERADMLRKKMAHYQNRIQEEENTARANATTNKPKALAALKRKKKLEEDLKRTENTLENIESQKDMLENASANAAVLKTMAETAKIVKQQHDNLDINKVEDIVDEMREQKEISEEISNILSQTTHKETDDDALLKELQDMQEEALDDKLKLPTVPTALPAADHQTATTSTAKATTSKDEEELENLKKWATAAQ